MDWSVIIVALIIFGIALYISNKKNKDDVMTPEPVPGVGDREDGPVPPGAFEVLEKEQKESDPLSNIDVTKLGKLTKAQLLDLVEENRISNVNTRMKKADIIDKIQQEKK